MTEWERLVLAGLVGGVGATVLNNIIGRCTDRVRRRRELALDAAEWAADVTLLLDRVRTAYDRHAEGKASQSRMDTNFEDSRRLAELLVATVLLRRVEIEYGKTSPDYGLLTQFQAECLDTRSALLNSVETEEWHDASQALNQRIKGKILPLRASLEDGLTKRARRWWTG